MPAYEHLTDTRSAVLPNRETALSARYLRILERWVPVGLEYFEEWPVRPNAGHFLGGCHWYGIETIAGALTFALVAGSPEHDEQITGCSSDRLAEIALQGLRYLCFTHDSGPEDCIRPEHGLGRPENCGTKWGERGKGFFRESQCGTTIAGMALVALLLGDRVDEETWSMLADVHADYAARFGSMAPKSGVYVNTQMEENGWTSCGLASALCLLSGSPAADEWSRTARGWMFSTASSPQDAKNLQRFSDGSIVAKLAGQTFTTLPDYMAENHGIVHPSYTASSLFFSGHLAVTYGMFGRELPEYALYNRQRIYDQLKFTTDSTGSLHPVQGMDWPYLTTDPGTGTHASAALLLDDPDGAALEIRALETLERRQESFGGRMLDRSIGEICHDIQDPSIVRESAITRPAYTYLMHRLLGDGPDPTDDRELELRLRGVRTYPHSGFVFHRHQRGQASFSWRNSIMALPWTEGGIHTVAPATGSLLCAIEVEDHPDSHDLQSIRVDEHEDAFASALVVDRAQGSVRQEVVFAGLPDGTTLSFERLRALERVVVRRAEHGLLRIINQDISAVPGNCDGYRTITTPDASERFAGFVSNDPESDVIRRFDHPRWINVDDRLGIVFEGSGETVYHNRHYFDPFWAVADDLVLSRIDEPFEVLAGNEISRCAIRLCPGQPGSQTPATERLIVLEPDRAVALLAGEYLAIANFDETERDITFSVPCVATNAVHLFPGTVSIGDDSISYTMRLRPNGVELRRARHVCEVDGEVDVQVPETGEVCARNRGSGKAIIRVRGSEKDFELDPGALCIW